MANCTVCTQIIDDRTRANWTVFTQIIDHRTRANCTVFTQIIDGRVEQSKSKLYSIHTDYRRQSGAKQEQIVQYAHRL